jgi:hypothetical protein
MSTKPDQAHQMRAEGVTKYMHTNVLEIRAACRASHKPLHQSLGKGRAVVRAENELPAQMAMLSERSR